MNLKQISLIFILIWGSLYCTLNAASQDLFKIEYCSYIGGLGNESGRGIGVDSAGNVTIAGFTNSPLFQFSDQNNIPIKLENDIFVMQIAPSDSIPKYFTFGGSSADECKVMELDSKGSLYISGRSKSYNFPVSEFAFGKEQVSTYDIIAVKFGAIDQIHYSNIFGGRAMEEARGMAVDKSGNCILVGGTHSLDFPVSRKAHKRKYTDNPEPDPGLVVYSSGKFIGEDAFITKISSDGTKMVFSTYFGGHGYDKAWAAATDKYGNIYVTGYSTSEDLPVKSSAFQSEINGSRDTFVAKFSPDGKLLSSTYFGGREDDSGFGIAIDNEGRVWVAGNTNSFDLPVIDPIQKDKGGKYDLYLACFDENLQKLLFCSFFGGEGDDQLTSEGLFIDTNNNILLSGTTSSSDFPTLNAVKKKLTREFDGFCVMIDGQNKELLFATYLGGSGKDNVENALIKDGKIYITGTTDSYDLPTTNNAIQKTLAGENDAFLVIIERMD